MLVKPRPESLPPAEARVARDVLADPLHDPLGAPSGPEAQAPVQFKMTSAPTWTSNLMDTVAEKSAHIRRYFYQSAAFTDSGRTVQEELDEALWATKPKGGKEGAVTTYRGHLWTARAKLLKAIDDADASYDHGAMDPIYTDLTKWTNLILDNAAHDVTSEWKADAANTADNASVVQWNGAAVAALVKVPGARGGMPVPKKIQLSVDRHLWGRLTAMSTSKFQNTMLRHDVSEATVGRDMTTVASEYLTKMGQDKTSPFTMDSTDGKRKYYVEKLTGEEPHVFPYAGAEQTIDVNQPMHEVLKVLKGTPPASNDDWTTLVGSIKAKAITPSDLYDKMGELKLPRATINELKREVDKRA